jgi:predicted Zn finger-like uncharacterized protein
MKITCEKCSAPYEIEDSRIPVSGFIMKCPACMHSFKVMRGGAPAEAAASAPPPPAMTGSGPPRYHVRRRTGKTFGPFVESAIVTMLQNGKLDGDEQVSTDGNNWLPLAAVAAFAPWAKPASGEIEDLPAPKGPSPSGIIDLPAPKRPVGMGVGIPDLPTPKGAMPRPPMPGTKAPSPATKAPVPTAMGIPDLPAPKRPVGMGGGIPDLPAPKGAPAARPPAGKPAMPPPPVSTKPPAPTAGPRGIVDLPTPKGPTPTGIVDLPKPKGPTPSGIVDLPTPKGPTALGIPDLPMPKGPVPTGLVDLPTPKGRPSGLDDFDLAPVGGSGALDLGEVDLPTPKAGFGDSLPPPPPPLSLGDMELGGDPNDAAAIISSPGAEEMRSIPDSSIDVVAPRQSNQLHVDLDAVDGPADSGIDLVAPRGFPAPVAEETDLAPPEMDARPAPRPAAKPARKVAPAVSAAAAPDKRKKMLILGGVFAGGLLIAAAAIMVLKSMGVGGERIDQVALAKLRTEIAVDNYDVLVRVGTKIKLSAEAQPKNIDQHAMAAQVLALAAIAHRGEAKHANAAAQLIAAIEKNDGNPELTKARAAVAIAQGHPQDAEAMLTQLVGEAGKGGNDAFAQLLLGWAQFKGNRAKSAEVTFQKALSLDGKLAGAAWGMALCRDKAGDKAGVETWAQKTVERSPAHFAALLMQAREKPEDSIAGLLQLHGSKGSPAEQGDAWALVGSKQLAELRLDEAEASYKKALVQDPTNQGALLGMGDTLYQLGRFVESKEKLDAAQKAAPGNLDVIVSLARTQLALGQPLLAQDLLQAAAKSAPKDARIRLLQGRTEETLDKDGAAERAQALYKQAIDLDPKLVEAYSALAHQALKVSRPDEAQRLAADAMKNAGDNADTRTLIGNVLLAQEDPSKAQIEFQKALEKTPNHLAARMGLAAALEAQKKPDAALAELEKIRAKVPAYPGLSQRLGALYQALGRVDDAAKAYEAALNMPGASIPLKFSAANFFYGVQKCERARQLTEQITNEDPKNSDAYELLARVWECAGRRDQAMMAIHHAIELSDKPMFHLTKARLHEKANQGNDALVDYQIAADAGHIGDAYIGRASLLLDHGANREAIHDCELALKLDKNRCDARKLIGKGNLGLQNYKVAEGHLREATHCAPKDPEAQYLLAQACTGAHDFPCACSAYWQAAQLGLKGENLGDAYFEAGMCEKGRGSQGRASEAFKKCLEVGTDIQKQNCGKELSNLGGFR